MVSTSAGFLSPVPSYFHLIFNLIIRNNLLSLNFWQIHHLKQRKGKLPPNTWMALVGNEPALFSQQGLCAERLTQVPGSTKSPLFNVPQTILAVLQEKMRTCELFQSKLCTKGRGKRLHVSWTSRRWPPSWSQASPAPAMSRPPSSFMVRRLYHKLSKEHFLR